MATTKSSYNCRNFVFLFGYKLSALTIIISLDDIYSRNQEEVRIGEILSRFEFDTLKSLLDLFNLFRPFIFEVLPFCSSGSIDSIYSKTMFDCSETLLRFILTRDDYRCSLLSANNFKLD